MCRLFAFRSVIQSQVHRSLVQADNALGTLSTDHPDGWGVAYYVDGAPHVTRSPNTALDDHLFHRVSGVVASETVLAHVRKATVGTIGLLNCHPFQHGRWTFAHNGEVKHFARYRKQLLEEIAPRFRRFVLGETDSETLFFLFLSQLAGHGQVPARVPAADAVQAMRSTIQRIREICDGEGEQALLTFVATDGVTMVASQGGKELYYSTYKTECGDRDRCPHLAPECEAPTTSGFVNHLVLSSEQIVGENVWEPLAEGDILAVDWRMRLERGSTARRHLGVLAS
jgi:glutamine amidotransferase